MSRQLFSLFEVGRVRYDELNTSKTPNAFNTYPFDYQSIRGGIQNLGKSGQTQYRNDSVYFHIMNFNRGQGGEFGVFYFAKFAPRATKFWCLFSILVRNWYRYIGNFTFIIVFSFGQQNFVHLAFGKAKLYTPKQGFLDHIYVQMFKRIDGKLQAPVFNYLKCPENRMESH